jgi:ornithine decarboxylase
LREGDLLLSPTMGAYTSVTATTFNGRRAAKVVVLERAVTVQRADALRLSTH